MKLYSLEYMQAGSGVPVDCTVGLHSKEQSIRHGRQICQVKDYCGFWLSTKASGTKDEPVKVEFHPVTKDPTGKRVVFGKVVTR